MLTFKQFIKEEAAAKRFVADLLEQASKQEVFHLTETQQERMKEILALFPHILERHGPEHIKHLPSKRLPDLDQYDDTRD